ncbi:hypothetical protein L917_04400 [Phytophthora nicotianae]|uniref:Uncharacterized protein n=1 Tax=Phytophthora nicotianae TaxID=4792 RepID=W2LPC8_PHYNI|nr:hypothetical protein L915_20164 [Phytophthora nicotianae]ETL98559.1 hypothetical protein L917_04400 [Phytophthora nicotianae]ETM51727.1 hypothetical protein L914_04500 [Phytophthora nicotianae]
MPPLASTSCETKYSRHFAIKWRCSDFLGNTPMRATLPPQVQQGATASNS